MFANSNFTPLQGSNYFLSSWVWVVLSDSLLMNKVDAMLRDFRDWVIKGSVVFCSLLFAPVFSKKPHAMS